MADLSSLARPFAWVDAGDLDPNEVAAQRVRRAAVNPRAPGAVADFLMLAGRK